MQSIDYNIYIQDTKSLIRTMVIKSEATADLVNTGMQLTGYPYNEMDKKTWKYYQNLAGIYHASDEMMTVKSLDTDEIIDFTVQNLTIHLATKRGYQHGTENYRELVERYPEQTALIKGILNPIDIDVAIDAPDHKILFYNQTLVLWNEEPLIPRLQEWIDGFFYEWDHPDYYQTDNLMLHYMLGMMWMLLPGVVLGIRLEHIGQRYAHEFHIWSHLDSNGDLFKYKPYLDRTQVMHFYRNIVWYQHNNGKQYTMDKLVDVLLTGRGIPLGEYTAKHDTEVMPEENKPDVFFERKQLNLLDLYGDLRVRRDTPKLMYDEVDQARDNIDVYVENTPIVKHDVQTTLMSALPTKVLESEMIDKTNSGFFTRMSVLVNEWAYLSQKNLYRAVVKIDNPKNGLEMSMGVKDAFILFMYAIWQTEKTTLKYIPGFYYFDVRKTTQPTKTELRKAGSARYITDEYMNQALANPITFPSIISTESFYNKCDEVFKGLWQHQRLYSWHSHYEARAHLKNMTRRFYSKGLLTFENNVKYEDWLEKKGWDLTEISTEDWETFAYDLFGKATGWDLASHLTMNQIQENMIKLMLDLSSYTIQVIRKINMGDLVDSDGNKLSIGDVDYDTEFVKWIMNLPIVINAENTILEFDVDAGLNPDINEKYYEFETELVVDQGQQGHEVITEHFEETNSNLIGLQCWVVEDEQEGTPILDRIPYPTLNGMWATPFGGNLPHLSEKIINNILDGLYATSVKK